jgi:hypothetical protein
MISRAERASGEPAKGLLPDLLWRRGPCNCNSGSKVMTAKAPNAQGRDKRCSIDSAVRPDDRRRSGNGRCRRGAVN